MDDLAHAFRAALRGQASTVCLVTAATPAGPRGMTATAVMSLSADPPALALAVSRSASMNSTLAEGAAVSIQFLGDDQAEIAQCFAGGSPPDRRFESVAWRVGEWGSPVLEGAAATLSGVVEHRVETSTHSLIIVAVRAAVNRAQARPLLYAYGQFTVLAAPGCRCAA
jgi:flavin reductase (DIM6/NTAB) family NADH-FMN oxidoreductase RutF